MVYQALINRGSSVSLDVDRNSIGLNGTKVQQWNYNATPNQHWDLVDAGEGFVWLRNVESAKALDIDRNVIGQNGARAQQWSYNATPNQQWQQVPIDDGWFWLRNRESGKALDVHVYDLAKNGATTQQWDYLGTANQQWRVGGDTGTNRFVFGAFDFDAVITADQICTLVERHRFAFSRISGCNNLTAIQRQSLSQTYQRAIWHGINTNPGENASAVVGGSQIWVNFGNLFPQGMTEIAQTLIHEMMHCAGFSHPQRRDPPQGMSCANPNPTLFDCPFDNGPYYGTPPLQAEICIAGNQSDLMLKIEQKAREDHCIIDEQGIATIHCA